MEVGKLRETLKAYGEEFAEVKNQEVTIRQLREKLRVMEEEAETTVEARVGEREAALRAAAEERERSREEAVSAVQLKLSASEAEVARLEANLAAARDELNRLRSRVEDRSDAGAAQVELLQEDAERAQQRAEAAERQLSTLAAEVAALRSAQAPEDPRNAAADAEDSEALLSSLRAQLAAKVSLNSTRSSQSHQLNASLMQESQLMSQMEEAGRLRRTADEAKAAGESTEAELQNQLAAAEARADAAQAKLSEQADYTEIKSQLAYVACCCLAFGGREMSWVEDADGDGVWRLQQRGRAKEPGRSPAREEQSPPSRAHHPPDGPPETPRSALSPILLSLSRRAHADTEYI